MPKNWARAGPTRTACGCTAGCWNVTASIRYRIDLPDRFYTQGALQLALDQNAEEFLAGVIGFNLGYEQLPLHLLITAREL